MKSSSIRTIIILAVLCILGITTTQIYWVSRAFNLKKDEFERQINLGLYNVALQVCKINKIPLPVNNPVKQISTNYFVVMVNNTVDFNTLELLLKSEFEKRHIDADFEYGIYDCVHEKMVYGDYVSLGNTPKNITKSFPQWNEYEYFFGVQFPNKESHIVNQMGIWIFSTVVLVIVIVFFAYTLFVILKQKRLSEIQKDFVNNMTHEFKTPISTIALSANVLQDPDIIQHPGRLKTYTGIIERENNRLKEQVERVLQIAKFDTGEIRLKKELLSIHDLIDEVIVNQKQLIENTETTITRDFKAQVSLVTGDKLHLSHVFYNLLDNAIKYTDTAPQVIIRTKNSQHHLIIEVEDNGIGIHPSFHRKIFKRFFRVPTGNVHNVKGFGIGLSYIQNIIAVHKGKIQVHSSPHQGSIFQVNLNLA